LIAIVAQVPLAARELATRKIKGAEQISPAELEKKYEEGRQLLVTPDYISRSSLHGDSKYKKARQFLNLAPVVSSTPVMWRSRSLERRRDGACELGQAGLVLIAVRT
jgi:hypothetical protein